MLVLNVEFDVSKLHFFFPSVDKVTIRGVADDVAKAKKQLTALASERQING